MRIQMAMTTESGRNTQDLAAAECAAHDLKAMMGDVIRQISEADHRNTALLRQMQDRLATLGNETRSARATVPSEYQPGFDRIEDGMALLASRIAASFAQRNATTAHPAEQFSLPDLPVAPGHNVEQPTYPPAAHTGHAPNFTHALRSSVTGPAAQRSGKYGTNVDTFDVVESLAGNAAEPWAPDHVEALTNLYSGAEPVYANAVHATPAAYAPNARSTPQPMMSATAQEASTAAADRSWLDARLADVSARLEQSLSNVRPDHAFAAIGQRFNELEDRLSVALSGVATRVDVQGLRVVEAHLQELNGQVERALSELSRLDGIEHHMSNLIDQVSDEHLSGLFRQAIAAQPKSQRADTSQADLHTVAITAAEAAASRVTQVNRDLVRDMPRADANSGRVDEVHSLLTGFIEERRSGDEYNAAMLDTMQQAMLRLLDRVEQMEAERAPAAFAHQGNEPYAPQLQAYPEDNYAPAYAPASTGDEIADRRADMQASAQRAAAAQRDKLKTETTAGTPTNRNIKAAVAAKGGAANTRSQSSRRLMVSSLILATVLAAGAVTVMMNRTQNTVMASPMTNDAPNAVAPAPAQVALPKPPVKSTAAEQPSKSATAITPPSPVELTKRPPTGANNGPVTVTEDIGQGGEVREGNNLPDLPDVKAKMSRISSNAAPMGIMVQDEAYGAGPLPAYPTTKIAANVGEIAPNAAPAVASGQARSSLDLPPATVGPLSLRMAAAAGDVSAEFEVASRLAEGKGTDQNFKEAIRWYQRSATQGFAQAQYRLGTLYERGLGVPVDVARAKSWYQRAAEHGNVKAMHNLAVLAAGRTSPSPDYVTAAQWFSQASAYNLADSQFNLAVLTESGLGIERDMISAAKWFILAAKSGDKEALRRRDLIKKQMPAADYAAAEKLAAAWKATVPDKLANDARFAGEAWKARQPENAADNG
jgi:localization factor PodJL